MQFIKRTLKLLAGKSFIYIYKLFNRFSHYQNNVKKKKKRIISFNHLHIIFIKVMNHLYKKSSICTNEIKCIKNWAVNNMTKPIRVCDLHIHYYEGHCIIPDYNHFRANIKCLIHAFIIYFIHSYFSFLVFQYSYILKIWNL